VACESWHIKFILNRISVHAHACLVQLHSVCHNVEQTAKFLLKNIASNLKVIHSHCVINQYVFHDNTVTHALQYK
jgi:adenylosuccinate lyase